MKLRTSILLGCAALFTATSCTTTPAKKSWSEQVIENARAQIGLEIDTIEASGKCLNPVTLNSKGGVYYCGPADWRSGFFPGSVWYLYELTGLYFLWHRNILKPSAKHNTSLGTTI